MTPEQAKRLMPGDTVRWERRGPFGRTAKSALAVVAEPTTDGREVLLQVCDGPCDACEAEWMGATNKAHSSVYFQRKVSSAFLTRWSRAAKPKTT